MIRWGGGGGMWRRKVTNSSLLVFNIFDLTKAHFSLQVKKRKEQERRDRRKELRRAIKKTNRVINQDGWEQHSFLSFFLYSGNLSGSVLTLSPFNLCILFLSPIITSSLLICETTPPLLSLSNWQVHLALVAAYVASTFSVFSSLSCYAWLQGCK